MSIRAAHSVIAVRDLSLSAAFYRDVLGFAIEEMAPGWRFFVKDACCIRAGECPDAMPVHDLGDHSYFLYLVVDDLDAVHGRALAQGAAIVKPLTSEPWGMREFGLRTADGHRIMLAQVTRS